MSRSRRKREGLRGPRRFSDGCRSHGSCPYCQGGRQYKAKKRCPTGEVGSVQKGLSEIVLVLDRSGSMLSTMHDAEGGLRAFIHKQKLLPGDCNVTFYRFDENIERVFDCKPIREVNEGDLTLHPRGSTALLDAMARAIDEVGDRLSNTHEDQRPEKVYFVTITDGEENCSRKNTTRDVFNRVSKQRDEYGWEFIYIGANQDAIETASKIGITPQYSMSYSGTSVGTVNAYSSLTANVTRSRKGTGDVTFSTGDRNSAMEK